MNCEKPESQTAEEPTDPYQIVADLLRRQDEVLQELDDLNSRVESAVNEMIIERAPESNQADSPSKEAAA